MGAPDTYLPPVKSYSFSTPADIPAEWPRLKARKKTPVTIRASTVAEEFSVPWNFGKLVSVPELDVIVKGTDGLEYPCKKDVFFSIYTPVPAVTNDDYIAGYQFVKSAVSTLVPIPTNSTVTVATLEGPVSGVTFPDFISIGTKDELYVNSREFVFENMTFV